jgi:hypothetical protein
MAFDGEISEILTFDATIYENPSNFIHTQDDQDMKVFCFIILKQINCNTLHVT